MCSCYWQVDHTHVFIVLVVIFKDSNHFKGDASNSDILLQWFFAFKKCLFDLGAYYCYFSELFQIGIVDEPSFNDLKFFYMLIVGINSPDIVVAVLLFVVECVVSPHLVARGGKTYSFNRADYFVVVFGLHLNIATGFHSLVRETCLPVPYPDGIGGR